MILPSDTVQQKIWILVMYPQTLNSFEYSFEYSFVIHFEFVDFKNLFLNGCVTRYSDPLPSLFLV